jgi:hypothetical protein
MVTSNESRDAARAKAAQLLDHRKQQETERLKNQERDRKALDEKIARLRALRLAKEAADREAAVAAVVARKSGRKA